MAYNPDYKEQPELPQELPVGYEYDEEETGGYLEGLLEKGNIVDELKDNAKATNDTVNLYGEAKASMDPWLKKYERAISLAKLQPMSGDQEINEKSFPFEGASLAMLPFITEAMLDFNSRAAPELVWSENIVRAKIYGEPKKVQEEQAQQMPQGGPQPPQQPKIKETNEKEERADRVSKYQNYQLAEQMPNWRDEQDKLLMVLPCVGTAYKETYYDYDKKLVKSDLLLANQIIFNTDHNNFSEAPDKFRLCKYSKNEVIGFIRGEQSWDLDESDLEEEKKEFEFIKAYTWFDLDDDGLDEPYCAMVCTDTNKIVALYPYFDEDTINQNDDGDIISVEAIDCLTQYRFLPDPEGGPMGMGWGVLLGPLFEAVNTNLRQLIDAGTISNAASNSGFIATDLAQGFGNSTESGPVDLILGQLTPINVRGGNLRDAIIQPPFAGPSPVLFQLLDYLVQAARKMSNAAANIESMPGESATLYLARLKQGLKVPNSIIMRVYSAAKKEKQKIGLLNYRHFDDEVYNKVLDGEQAFSMEADFNPEDCDIRLAADPAQGSDIERIQRAETVLQEAKDPQQNVLNKRQAYVDWLEALDHPNIDALAPEPDPNAVDPMQQMMVAQMQMDAEMKQKDQELRQSAQKLQELKLQMEAGKQAAEMGLNVEEQQAKIAETYSKTLKNIIDAGVAQSEQAISTVERIEARFIDAEGGNNARQVPPSIPAPVRPVASPPSNPGPIPGV